MSSKKYASPLKVELKPSVILFTLMAALHVLALALVWKMPILLPWQLTLSFVLLVSLYFHSVRHALRSSSRAVVAVEWNEDDQWSLRLRSGEALQAQLRGDSFVHPGLMILNFKVDGRYLGRSVLLPYKNGSCQPLRQLRVRLKLTAQRQEPEPA